ncbi:MAG: MazG-like family protein [Syntrophomonadaceae bacterium]|nr:MazG-like family protein [Syntrophomonadaceae bacterium]
MYGRGREIDIAKNLRVIEWLKAELVDSVGVLFKALLKTGNDIKVDALATIMIITYLLGRKVGINFQTLDMRVKNKLSTSINDSHEVEEWRGDLADLLNYLENKKR